MLDEHLDWEEIIPARFYSAFCRRLGRKRGYELESFLRALFLQRILHYVDDSQLLNTLRLSYEMRDCCGFEKVPDASKLTRFKQDFCEYIRDVFERLMDMTEPICAEMDKALTINLHAAPENLSLDFRRFIFLTLAAYFRRPCFYALFCYVPFPSASSPWSGCFPLNFAIT